MSNIQKVNQRQTPVSPVEQFFIQRIDRVARATEAAGISPEKFIDTVLYATGRDDGLSKADASSLFAAAVQCAQDGLIPDGREALLQVYGRKVSYMPMIGGFYKLAAQTPGVKFLQAVTIHQNDDFDNYLDHDGWHFWLRPNYADPGEKIATVALLVYEDNRMETEWITLEQMKAIRSQAKTQNTWNKFTEEMEKKAAIKRLAKRLALGPRFQAIVDLDNKLDYSFDDADEPVGAQEIRVTSAPKISKKRALPRAESQLEVIASMPEPAPEEEPETIDAEFDDAQSEDVAEVIGDMF